MYQFSRRFTAYDHGLPKLTSCDLSLPWLARASLFGGDLGFSLSSTHPELKLSRQCRDAP